MATNGSVFLGWSIYKPTASNVNTITYLSTATVYQYVFRSNTTIYAIFNNNSVPSLNFCYYPTVAGYIATVSDKAYYCGTCTQTVTVYFKASDYAYGYDKITWYKNSACTIVVDPGYYRYITSTTSNVSSPFYRLYNGVPTLDGYCGGTPLPSC